MTQPYDDFDFQEDITMDLDTSPSPDNDDDDDDDQGEPTTDDNCQIWFIPDGYFDDDE